MATSQKNGKKLTTQQSFNSVIMAACDILRRSNLASALQYIPELSWLLFLRILDEWEDLEAERVEAVGGSYTASLAEPYRWKDWAAPEGQKRLELMFSGGSGSGMFAFVNGDLVPQLKALGGKSDASARQRVISQIVSGVPGTRVDTEKNFLDVLDKLNEIRQADIDPTHIFPISQVFEGLLLKMGEKNNDGGQFFTPRPVIRAIVQVIDPQPGETIYDPTCGTGGFLIQSYEHMLPLAHSTDAIDELKERTFYGREKDDQIYPIALSNAVLHGIDFPRLWHGNTLTGQESYGGLFEGAPAQFDVILTNPPFGGKEGIEAQVLFDYRTSATQVLCLQHMIKTLKPGGRCGVVLDEGVLFRANESAFTQTKRKLLDDCDVWCILSLPAGTFIGAGGGVKTNILFFTKGKPTEKIWYYDLSGVKVTKKQPLTVDHFAEFFELLPTRADSDRSWTVTRDVIDAKNYDLKAVNPNARHEEDTRTPDELLDFIEEKGREVSEALARLRARM